MLREIGLTHAPWLALCAADGNASFLCVVEEIVAACESLVEFGQTPGGNDLDGGLESVEREFETDLVVSLTGATVRDSNASFLLCNFDLGASNDGASKGGSCWEVSWSYLHGLKGWRLTQKVDVLIDGVALNSWEAQLLNVARDSSNLQRLCLCSLEVLCVPTVSLYPQLRFETS
jgi:hypothetical protein